MVLTRQLHLRGLEACFCTAPFGQSPTPSPAAMISDFWLQHGEGRVTLDKTLTRIAHEQAADRTSSTTIMR
jgi:hypothetical protein